MAARTNFLASTPINALGTILIERVQTAHLKCEWIIEVCTFFHYFAMLNSYININLGDVSRLAMSIVYSRMQK